MEYPIRSDLSQSKAIISYNSILDVRSVQGEMHNTGTRFCLIS